MVPGDTLLNPSPVAARFVSCFGERRGHGERAARGGAVVSPRPTPARLRDSWSSFSWSVGHSAGGCSTRTEWLQVRLLAPLIRTGRLQCVSNSRYETSGAGWPVLSSGRPTSSRMPCVRLSTNRITSCWAEPNMIAQEMIWAGVLSAVRPGSSSCAALSIGAARRLRPPSQGRVVPEPSLPPRRRATMRRRLVE